MEVRIQEPPICAGCRYAQIKTTDNNTDAVLECWRFPPSYIVLDGEPFGIRPQVEAGDWCGEWAQEGP